MNAVLMAGGGGSRLWPLSRQSLPKQFLDLGTGQTLIQEAYQRASALTTPDRIFVATNENFREHVEKLLPQVPSDHIFYEPEKRDTTAAFATIALRLEAAGYAEEPTIFMWSDHVFSNEGEFLNDLKKIPAILQQHPDSIVIFGHTPISPETGLGYMEVGEKLAGHNDVFHLKSFTEKPNQETAEHYVTAGNYYWNLGYFSLRPAYLISQLLKHNPDLAGPITAMRQVVGSQDQEAFAQTYHQFPKVAIEYTLIEKTSQRIAITGDYGWSDIGNWATMKEIFGKSGDHMPSGHHVHVDSQNNYVYNTTSRAVSLVGLTNTIVVVTDDAILITDKDHAHKVKQVVERLEQEGKKEYM